MLGRAKEVEGAGVGARDPEQVVALLMCKAAGVLARVEGSRGDPEEGCKVFVGELEYLCQVFEQRIGQPFANGLDEDGAIAGHADQVGEGRAGQLRGHAFIVAIKHIFGGIFATLDVY